MHLALDKNSTNL